MSQLNKAAFACAIVAALSSAAWASPGLAGEYEFAGTTVLHSEGPRVARFELPRDGTLTSSTIETSSAYAAVVVLNEGYSGIYRLKAGEAWAGQGGNESASLPAGKYYVYLVSDGPMETTLRFAGLGGETTVVPAATVGASFQPLAPSDIIQQAAQAFPIPTAEHLSGQQPFDGIAVTGFMRIKHTMLTEDESVEFRWSNARGTTACVGYFGGGNSLWGWSWRGIINLHNNGARTSLDYFRNGVAVTLQDDVYGFWIERAAGHHAGPELEAVQPLLAPLDASLPDVDCLRSNPPKLPIIVPAVEGPWLPTPSGGS